MALRRWIPLLALCACTLAYWSAQYQPFLLPNNDWYSFEDAARSLARLELPQDFKRMPLFPGVIALLGPLMPELHRELHAALVANIVLSLGTLALLHRFASLTLGKGALLVPVLFASSVQFHAMGLQPLVEPSLGFSVVLAFVLFEMRSPWQYAAAFAAGLGRAEAALLSPVLAAVNVFFEGRLPRHAALATAAVSGTIAWTLLGALRGKGQNFYLALMEGMGWKPDPDFALRVLREGFAFLNVHGPALVLALLAVLALIAAGTWYAWRECRREALALLGFLGATVGTVVFFGVDKARYVYPIVWIPIFFASFGLVRVAEAAQARLAALPARMARSALVLAALAFTATTAVFLAYLRRTPDTAPLAVDLAFAIAVLALGGYALSEALRVRSARGAAAWCAAMAVVAALVLGGVARKRIALENIHDANYGAWMLAHWLEENMQPDDRAIVLGRRHLTHLTRIPKERLQSFSKVEGETPEELAAHMRERGYTLVAYTHRDPVKSRASAWYYETLNVRLAEAFKDGAKVKGFEHVATLDPPADIDEGAVQIYRLGP